MAHPYQTLEEVSFRMDSLNFQLLNEFQKNFPLAERPFARIGEKFGLTEIEVLSRYRDLMERGFISRIGAVLPPQSLGVSTLAAMAVPETLLTEVAGLVSSYSQVNHNYAREDFFNLWFVVTAGSEDELQRLFEELKEKTGIEILDLRLVEEYRIDLGFDLEANFLKDKILCL